MTGVLEAAPLDDLDDRPDAGALPASGGWARLRAELRLARRATWRSKGASALVVALVAVPMMLVSGGLVVFQSHQPTLQDEVDAELGRAAARLEAVSGPDPSLTQSAGDPWNWDLERDADYGPVNPVLPPIDDPSALLPAGTRVIEVGGAHVTARTPGGIGALPAVIGAPWDPALEGHYEFVSGERPARAGEAMVSPGALQRLHAQIGDTLELTEPRASFVITGVLKAASQSDAEQAVFLPSTTALDATRETRTWFTPDWQPTAADLPEFNHEGVVVFGRDLMMRRDGGRYVDSATAFTVAAATSIVAAFAGYLVVLLAGAAFSVSTRRQQQSLAVASSVGAPTGSLRRIVLLQGTVLGLVGGAVGAALGVAAAWPALLLLDDGRNGSFWGFYVPWWGVLAIVLFAVAVGTIAALLPARAATRGDVLQSLRGARRPVTLHTRRPVWGVLLIAAGIGLAVLGSLMLAGLSAPAEPEYGSPAFTLATWAIIGGPLLFQIGVIVAGHWLLTMIARIASRFGLATRLGVRDAAANPGRIVPAFAAIAACVFLASFALSAVAINTSALTRTYWWQGPEGSVLAHVWSADDGSEAAEREAIDAISDAGPDEIAVVRGEPTNYTFTDDGPTDERLRTVFRAERFGIPGCGEIVEGACQDDWGRYLSSPAPLVVAEDELATALGTDVPEAALEVFRAGGALVMVNAVVEGTVLDDGEVRLSEYGWEVLEPGRYDGGSIAEPLRTVTIPGAPVTTPHSVPWETIISPETAAQIGLATSVRTVVGTYDEPPSQETLDELALRSSIMFSGSGGFSFSYETGPMPPDVWLWLILAAVGTLVVTAGSIALGLSRVERRPDDATLTAVGATPLLRRGIAFTQALVLVGLGAITGTIAGLIPMWGIVLGFDQGRPGSLSIADTPWPWLAILAVGLPVAMAAANWALPPRHPDLTRRTAIA